MGLFPVESVAADDCGTPPPPRFRWRRETTGVGAPSSRVIG